jgi:peptidyl-prolyl cis-trans isomerase C
MHRLASLMGKENWVMPAPVLGKEFVAMTIRSPRSLMLAAVISSLALPALAAAPANEDPVVAVVNGKEIRRSAVIEAQQSIPQARQMPLEQIYDQLLDQVITNELVLDQAKKQKLEDDAQVKAAFKDAQNAILRRAWVAKKVEADITEAQVKARFEELVKTMQPQEQVHARHILVDSEDGAKAVLADLKSGISFEDEAKAKSKDPSAKTNGGDLGFITEGETVKEFSEVAFKMKPGEITQAPVKTQFGWHVIKVEERRMAPPPTYDEAKGQVRQQLAQEDIAKVIEGLKKGAAVKRFKLDGTPAEAAPKAPAKN